MAFHRKANPSLVLDLPYLVLVHLPHPAAFLNPLHPDTFLEVTPAPLSPQPSLLSVRWTIAHKCLKIPQEHGWKLLSSLTFFGNQSCFDMNRKPLLYPMWLCVLSISQPPAFKPMDRSTGAFHVQGTMLETPKDTLVPTCPAIHRQEDALPSKLTLWENQE